MDSTRPGEPQWRIPIAEMVPIVGRLFQGPPKRETIRQESLKAQQEIRATAIKTTLDLAEALVKERTTESDLVRLTDECVVQIGKPALPS